MQFRTSPFSNLPPVVKNLLVINIAMFLLLVLAQLIYKVDLNMYLGLYQPQSEAFKPYQLVTHMFMHGGLAHIFFNMFALFMFGRVLEQVWGGKRFLIYYLVTGFGAALLHMLVGYLQAQSLLNELPPDTLAKIQTDGLEALRAGKNYVNPEMARLNAVINTPTIGASGAVFGLLLAFGMLFPDTRLMLIFPPIPIRAKYFVIGYGALELYLGLTQPGSNVAHFAHLGGMLFGIILIYLWKKGQFNKNQWN
ncbi:MAG: rhomboid family intramembrane serine protease [Candidatus Delongbacteria bacterium]|nr:rhomboid family intramembrane serine protease [Candidatus Delongbacteria bacterium]